MPTGPQHKVIVGLGMRNNALAPAQTVHKILCPAAGQPLDVTSASKMHVSCV